MTPRGPAVIRQSSRFCSAMIGIVSFAASAAADSAGRFDLFAENQVSTATDTKTIVHMIDTWGEAVARCRAVAEEDQAASEACGAVHKLLIKLDDLGWC